MSTKVSPTQTKVSQERFLEFSRPFISGAKNVFETMIFTKIEPQKPNIKRDMNPRGDITAVMGITGKFRMDNVEHDFKGMMVLSWPMETYLKTAGAMLMETYTEYTQDITDVGAEISNMITGNAKRDLKELGYSVDMAIPSLIVGKDLALNYPSGTFVVVIPFVSAHGSFFMELGYNLTTPAPV